MFGAPDSDDDDGLFSSRGGLFDSGGGLFDSKGADDDGGLFDDVADVDVSQFKSQKSKKASSSGEFYWKGFLFSSINFIYLCRK